MKQLLWEVILLFAAIGTAISSLMVRDHAAVWSSICVALIIVGRWDARAGK